MIYPADAALHDGPKALNGVGVDISTHVDTRFMPDAPMLPTALAEFSELSPLIGVNEGARHDVLANEARVDVRANRADVLDLDASLALNGSEDGLFVVDVPAPHAASSPADVGVVNLDCAGQRLPVLSHQLVSDFVGHAPRRLVGNAKFALQLLSGNAASGAGHEVHGVKP